MQVGGGRLTGDIRCVEGIDVEVGKYSELAAPLGSEDGAMLVSAGPRQSLVCVPAVVTLALLVVSAQGL